MVKQLIFLCLLLPVFAKAQTGDSIKTQLVRVWTRSETYTLEYLEAMPADKYGFRPADSIRNFAQQMIHLAQANVSLMNASTDQKIPDIINRQDLEQTQSAWSKDSVRYFITLSYDFAIAAVKVLNMNTAFERVSRGPLNESRFAWALKAYEHQAHHRGQTTIYLRVAGIKPPAEKLFN